MHRPLAARLVASALVLPLVLAVMFIAHNAGADARGLRRQAAPGLEYILACVAQHLSDGEALAVLTCLSRQGGPSATPVTAQGRPSPPQALPAGSKSQAKRTYARAPSAAPVAESPAPVESTPEPTPLADPPDTIVIAQPASLRGPPGVRMILLGHVRPPCGRIRLFFDKQPIGEVASTADGSFSAPDVSASASAKPGRHAVSAVCSVGDGRRLPVVTIQILAASLHRPGFSASLPSPSDVKTNAGAVAGSAAVAAGAVGLIGGASLLVNQLISQHGSQLTKLMAVPGELFNRTLDENYQRLARALRRQSGNAGDGSRSLLFTAGFFAIGGLCSSFIDPSVRLGPTFLLLCVAMMIGLALVAFGFDLPAFLFARRREGGTISTQARAGALVAAIACVAVSRLTKMQPGYLYGLLAGLAFWPPLDGRRDGQVNAIAATVTLGVAVVAFFLRTAAGHWSGGEHPAAIAILCETILAVIYAAGIEAAIFGMLPIEFLRGKKVYAWNRGVWALLFGLAVFMFVHAELQPSAKGSSGPSVVTTLFFLAFGAVTVGVWATFRYIVKPDEEPAEPDRVLVE